MKTLLGLAALLLISAPALATEISNDMANAYYQNCLKGSAPNLTDQAKQTMCACTAAKMKTGLSVEDMKMMSQQDENGRLATNKMIVNVYAPCIQYPAYDYYYSACASNPQTAKMSRNPQALCQCLAGKVSAHLAQNSQQIFRDILTRSPYITDPMAALTNDPQFDQFAQSQLLSCVK